MKLGKIAQVGLAMRYFGVIRLPGVNASGPLIPSARSLR